MKRKLNEVIRLSDEQKKQITSEIRAFYLDDSMRWLKEQLGNLEVDYYMLYKDIQ